jgi:hypothetical protein
MAGLEASRLAPAASARAAALAAPDAPVFTFVLVKLASRCNINCTYCYWFRDADVYKKPAVLSVESEDAFCRRLEDHIAKFELGQFMLVFHGGEPLLFPKHRFVDFQEKLDGIEARTGCQIDRGLRPTRSCSTTAGPTSSRSMAWPSASAWTVRPTSTTGIASISRARARTPRRCADLPACGPPASSPG